MTGVAPESVVAPSELASLEHEPGSTDGVDMGRTSHTEYLCKDRKEERQWGFRLISISSSRFLLTIL